MIVSHQTLNLCTKEKTHNNLLTINCTPGRDKTGAYRNLIVQVEEGKVRSTGRGKADTGSHEELLRFTNTGGKRRREVEAGRWGHRPGGRSLRAQARWKRRSWCKESEKRS